MRPMELIAGLLSGVMGLGWGLVFLYVVVVDGLVGTGGPRSEESLPIGLAVLPSVVFLFASVLIFVVFARSLEGPGLKIRLFLFLVAMISIGVITPVLPSLSNGETTLTWFSASIIYIHLANGVICLIMSIRKQADAPAQSLGES